jgi:hypothetical protein
LYDTALSKTLKLEVWASPRQPDTWLCGLQLLTTIVELPLDR